MYHNTVKRLAGKLTIETQAPSIIIFLFSEDEVPTARILLAYT